MNARSPLFLILALSLSSSLAACGADEPEPQKTSMLQLSGTYRPVTEGAIGSITFTNNRDYYLVPSGCTAGDCVDIGTYRLDAATSTIVLKNGDTGRERTITLENVKTSDAAAALVKTFVGTREFVGRGQETTGGQQQLNGDQQQVTGDQQQLNEGQQKLAEKIVDLIKTVVEALFDKQDMKKDDQKQDDQKDDPKDDEDPKPNPFDCTQGVPTANSTAAEKLAYAARCPNGP